MNNPQIPILKASTLFLPSAVVFVHGVGSDGKWYQPIAEQTFKLYQKNSPTSYLPIMIPFSWGDYQTQDPGGNPLYAVDEVHQMFRNPALGYDRLYQGHASIRLKELLDTLNNLDVQTNVIAHSNGTLITVAALLLGARLDNFLLMGSPLDCDNDRSQNELVEASKTVRGKIYNLWTHKDEWASVKGGIGGFGDNEVYLKKNPRIRNIIFEKGTTINDLPVFSEYGARSFLNLLGINQAAQMEFHHSDYVSAQNAPIIASFVHEFTQAALGQISFTPELFEPLFIQADWRSTSHYKEKKNITLLSPEMKKYRDEIENILEGYSSKS